MVTDVGRNELEPDNAGNVLRLADEVFKKLFLGEFSIWDFGDGNRVLAVKLAPERRKEGEDAVGR